MPDEHEPLEGVLEPWSRKVPIVIEGATFLVPENQSVIRVLQYLGLKGDLVFEARHYCWNGTCDECPCLFRDPATGGTARRKACNLRVVEGLEIVRLAPTMRVRVRE